MNERRPGSQGANAGRWAIAAVLSLVVSPACRDTAPPPSAAVGSARVAGSDSPPAAPTPAPALALVLGADEAPPALELGVDAPHFGVVDLVTCEDVVLRECRGERWRFPAGTKRVWAFATIRSPETKARVTLRWRRAGAIVRDVPVHVGQNPRWRTWSFLDVPADGAGEWAVEVLRPDDEVMARRRFLVE